MRNIGGNRYANQANKRGGHGDKKKLTNAPVSTGPSSSLPTPKPEPTKLPDMPEADIEQKPEAHVQQKPEARLEQKPEAHVQEKPEAHVEQKPDQEKPEAHVQQKPEAHVQEKPEAHVQPKPKPHAQQKPKPHVQQKPEEPPQVPPKPDQHSSLGGKAIPVVPTEDMEKIAEIMRAMKFNVDQLTEAFQAVGRQAEELSNLHGSMALQEEAKRTQVLIKEQIERRKEDIAKKRRELEILLLEPLKVEIQERVNSKIREAVKIEVANRVRKELERQIPEQVKEQAARHCAWMHEIDTSLYNAEAKRRNANVKRSERLHPLRIAKTAAMSRSSSGSTGYTPSTAGTSLQTPLDSNSLQLLINPTRVEESLVSPAFPYSVQTMLEYVKSDREKIRQLVTDYGGDASSYDPEDEKQTIDLLNKALDMIGIQGPGRLIFSPGLPRCQTNVHPANEHLLSPLLIARN